MLATILLTCSLFFIPLTTEKVGSESVLPKEEYRIEATDEDIDLMARVVMSESSILCEEAKLAVAEVIVNRVMSDKFPNTISEVVYQKKAFSTKDNGEPTEDCYKVVRWALEQGTYPEDMFWFRENYVTYGEPYMKIKNMCFSTVLNYEEEIRKENLNDEKYHD